MHTYEVDVEVVVSIPIEAETPEAASDIVAALDFPLGKEILQRITDGNYEVREIEALR